MKVLILILLVSVKGLAQSQLDIFRSAEDKTACVTFFKDKETVGIHIIPRPICEVKYQVVKKNELDTLLNRRIRIVVKPAHYIYFRDSCQELCDNQSICISRELIPEWYVEIDREDFGEKYSAVKIETYPIRQQAGVALDTLDSGFIEGANDCYIPRWALSKFKRINCCESPRYYKSQRTEELLEFRLRDLGYEISHNSRIDSSEIEALSDFQARNNIQSGNIDRETLIALGLWGFKCGTEPIANIEWLR